MFDILVFLIIIGAMCFLMHMVGGGCCGWHRHHKREHENDEN